MLIGPGGIIILHRRTIVIGIGYGNSVDHPGKVNAIGIIYRHHLPFFFCKGREVFPSAGLEIREPHLLYSRGGPLFDFRRRRLQMRCIIPFHSNRHIITAFP